MNEQRFKPSARRRIFGGLAASLVLGALAAETSADVIGFKEILSPRGYAMLACIAALIIIVLFGRSLVSESSLVISDEGIEKGQDLPMMRWGKLEGLWLHDDGETLVLSRSGGATTQVKLSKFHPDDIKAIEAAARERFERHQAAASPAGRG